MKSTLTNIFKVLTLNLSLLFICFFSPFVSCVIDKQSVCPANCETEDVCIPSPLSVSVEILLVLAFLISVAAVILAFKEHKNENIIILLDSLMSCAACALSVLLPLLYGFRPSHLLPLIVILFSFLPDIVVKMVSKKAN